MCIRDRCYSSVSSSFTIGSISSLKPRVPVINATRDAILRNVRYISYIISVNLDSIVRTLTGSERDKSQLGRKDVWGNL